MVVRLQLDRLVVTHRQVFEDMRDQGIGVNLHYISLHTQPYYRKFCFQLGDSPEPEKYYQEALTLPLFPGMNEEDQDRVVGALKRILPTERIGLFCKGFEGTDAERCKNSLPH